MRYQVISCQQLPDPDAVPGDQLPAAAGILDVQQVDPEQQKMNK